MLLYATTIFSSAFLLFLIQPAIAKRILPWFGGSAAVWTTCMLFFQVTLLLGYAYAHWSVRRLKSRYHIMLHLLLLAASLLALPVTPNPVWRMTGEQDPAPRILALLALSVGLPYFLLSTTGPLVQAWYARARNEPFPYRLYALSNLGSMLALVAYPVAFEPWLRTHSQLIGWSAGYGLFVVLCGATALLKSGWKSAPVVTVAGSAEEVSPPEFRQKLLWMALAACASTLLLAVTNHLTQDVAPIPFLWVVPLALYLLTFIICFDRPRWYKRNAFLILMALSLWGMVQSIFQQVDLRVAIPVFSLGLFFCCMFCHGELARMRPHAQYLTAFYLMLSLGGALGGLFVGLAAPHLFPAYFELPIAMTGCAILATIIQKDNHRQYWLWLSAASVLVGISIVDVRRETKGARIVARNFYGAVRVVDEGEGEEAVRKLYHGVINHGAQYLADDKRDRATTYYARASGVGQAIQSTRRSTQRVGIVGLGTGTIAVYGQPGDHYRFYEINPLVVRLARTEFTFLRDSKAQVDIVLGDGRISLEQEPPQQFDILAVDAFSGDSIPVHLLTSEAFGLYFRHLKSDGVLALHLSNRYLELKTVAKQLADAFHKQALLIDTDDDEDDDEIFGATWVLIGSTKANEALERQATPIFVNRRTRLWTDDYSNLFQVLK